MTNEELEHAYRERPNVRRLRRAAARDEFDDWTDPRAATPAAAPDGGACARRAAAVRRGRADPKRPSVHLVLPRSFNDAQQIADKFKEAIPVILNLQSSDADSRSG